MAEVSVATDNRFTKQFGTPSHRATGKVINVMTEVVMEFIKNSPFLVMATSSERRRMRRIAEGRQAGIRSYS